MSDFHLPFGAVRNGIDVLLADEFRPLRNMRLGLLTNHSGLTLDGRRTIDVLHADEELVLDVIFTPEHGLTGAAADGEHVADGADPTTGIPVVSLFGDRDRPDEEHLEGLDAVLYDVQDVGCRFYTYISTLGYLLEACAEHRVRVFVLDRPNPIDGNDVEGPSSDASCESRTNYHPMPLRHGLTIGEIARLFNGERSIGADLRIATMAGWQRDLWHDQTGQQWINPSPNIRDLTAAVLYPGIGLLEGTNLSVGRGTPAPFHVVGAPWIDGPALAKRLDGAALPGMKYEALSFTPNDARHPYSGQACNGVRVLVEEHADLVPTALGIEVIRALRTDYAGKWDFKKLGGLLARPDLLDAIEDNADALDDLWQPDPEYFDARAKYLLY
jgi:uncharacterized protein YbbC (DUF1343 family)